MHRTIGKQRLAPHEAEALWRAWSTEKDKRARDRLVLSYSPMVRYLAVRKARELPAHCELDDLVSHGLLALIEAVDRFDPRKGASFEQYAWTRVAGAIMDELRRQDWAPRSVRRTARAIERKRDAFYAREGTLPSDEELARESSLDVDELRSVLADVERAEVGSLHAPARAVDDAGPVEVVETVASRAVASNPEAALLAAGRMAAIREAVAGLSERERSVLACVHVHELPGAEVGRMLGVTESRVSQILSDVRSKLRRELDAYDAVALR
ncbi:MAG TPA: FliA/WhiG family RNA polymerase sigma factor [Gaiellaceae bacterium]|nr:FliA/WhiG family RNA polymerase sigma factor [Gaiellaceae bacterium]